LTRALYRGLEIHKAHLVEVLVLCQLAEKAGVVILAAVHIWESLVAQRHRIVGFGWAGGLCREGMPTFRGAMLLQYDRLH
jgi:hypothetical protein